MEIGDWRLEIAGAPITNLQSRTQTPRTQTPGISEIPGVYTQSPISNL
ncbi:MAG: hypothetical protein M1140_07310 [Chloroflexi bacterium]|nr:hypothetical protein [Chloroflexota bacterium]